MKVYKDKKLKTIEDLNALILFENIAQLKKWGIQEHSLFVWYTILCEEVGELGKAILNYEYARDNDQSIKKRDYSNSNISFKDCRNDK